MCVLKLDIHLQLTSQKQSQSAQRLIDWSRQSLSELHHEANAAAAADKQSLAYSALKSILALGDNRAILFRVES